MHDTICPVQRVKACPLSVAGGVGQAWIAEWDALAILRQDSVQNDVVSVDDRLRAQRQQIKIGALGKVGDPGPGSPRCEIGIQVEEFEP